VDVCLLWVFVCCQVEVSASGWSLVQRSPTNCGVSECDLEVSYRRWPKPDLGCCATGKERNANVVRYTICLSKSVQTTKFYLLYGTACFDLFEIFLRKEYKSSPSSQKNKGYKTVPQVAARQNTREGMCCIPAVWGCNLWSVDRHDRPGCSSLQARKR
jgi:hypothetical protein